METSRTRLCLLIWLEILAISTGDQCHLRRFCQKNHVALFIFGDSLFDAGNNNYLKDPIGRANFWPYGESFFKFPTGRNSDGRIIPDFIAGYLDLPFILPYLEPGNLQFEDGANFASGGAGALVETHQGKTIDLKTQLGYFKKVKKHLTLKLGDRQTKKLLSRAIYIFGIGTNDYVPPIKANSSFFQFHSKQEYVGKVIGNLTTALEELYRNGARKFGLMSVGAVGCLPDVRAVNSGRCMKRITDIVKTHNEKLAIVLKQLETRLQGFKYSYFDFYDTFSERIKNPFKFGFKEGKSACCGTGPYGGMGNCGGKKTGNGYELCDNPDEYVFFDGHPTEKADKQFASLWWTGTGKLTWPRNLKQLSEIYM